MSDSVFLTDGNGTITGLVDTAYAGELVIPEYVAGERITAIGSEAFKDCDSLVSVAIPNSVTSIGEYAFFRCSLTSVTIPDGVTSIGAHAFSDCTYLVSVAIPNSLTSIEDGVFFNCSRLISVTIPNSVTSIGAESFYYCTSLASIIISDSVTSIGGAAFFYCTSLTSIIMPNSVTSIGMVAFGNCRNLTTIYVDDPNNLSAAVNSYDWSKTGSSGVTFALNPRYVDYLIKAGTLMDIGDSIRAKTGGTDAIAVNRFSEAIDGIKSGGGEEWFNDGNTHIWIHLEDGRTSPMLGVCPNGTVTVDWGDGSAPDTLTGTSTSTVKWTPNHEYGKAGDYVITLTVDGEVGFSGVSTTNTYAHILRHSSGSDAINGVYRNAVQKVELADSVTSIGNHAFRNCYNLTNINIPDSVTSIGGSAFLSCYSLASINIPDSVTSIGSSTFSNCYSLASINIPDSVTSIGSSTFYNCYSLTNINIPDRVTSINPQAFYNCNSLTNINIPDRVTSIGGSTFYNCNSLTNINIPDSVTSIGGSAFYNCNGVAFYDFTSHTAVPTLSSTDAFKSIASDCQIRVPAALADEWKAATNWSTYADYIVGV